MREKKFSASDYRRAFHLRHGDSNDELGRPDSQTEGTGARVLMTLI